MLVELSLTPLQPFGDLFAALLGFAMAHVGWLDWQHDFRRGNNSIAPYLHVPPRPSERLIYFETDSSRLART